MIYKHISISSGKRVTEDVVYLCHSIQPQLILLVLPQNAIVWTKVLDYFNSFHLGHVKFGVLAQPSLVYNITQVGKIQSHLVLSHGIQ